MFRYTRIIRVGLSNTIPSVNLRQKITQGINNSLRLYANKPPSLEDKCKASNDKPPEEKTPPPCRTPLYDGTVHVTEEDKRQKSNRRKLITGIALLGIALIALWKFLDTNPDFIKPPEKKKDRKKREILKIPSSSGDIPKNIKYVLIGGGTASFSAFRAIKSNDPTAQVLIITDDQYYPYMRPPLSKEMWYNEDPDSAQKLNFKQWNGSERSLFYEPDEFYVDTKHLLEQGNGGVAVARGWTVTKVDVVGKKVILEDGTEVEYDKCLIATGATPKNLDIFENASPAIQDKVSIYRNIFDYEDLEERLKKTKTIAIIGGGFLGSELACSLARRARKNQKQIVQIFKEPGNMGKVLPEYLSLWTTKKVQSEGVNVLANTEVEDVRLQNDRLQLRLSTGNDIQVDEVIVAVGVQANTELADSSQLEIDPELGGFLVNTELQARSHLYIAGDAACFYDTKFGRRRVEHHDHAVVSGRLAGENMTGASKPYHHQSMFWSDLGPDVGYEAIGIIDSNLPTVGVFAKGTPKRTLQDTAGASRARIMPIDNETDNDESTNTNDSKTNESSTNESETNESSTNESETNESSTNESETNETNSDNELEVLVPMDETEYDQDQDENYGKGVIFYLRSGFVVGIVLWNVFNRMSIARQVLNDNRKYDDLNEVAKLFNIHED